MDPDQSRSLLEHVLSSPASFVPGTHPERSLPFFFFFFVFVFLCRCCTFDEGVGLEAESSTGRAGVSGGRFYHENVFSWNIPPLSGAYSVCKEWCKAAIFFSDVRLIGPLCRVIERTDACLFRDTYKVNFSDGRRWMTYIPRMSQKHLINSAFKCMLDGSVQWSLTITVALFFFQECLPFIWLHGPTNKMTKGEDVCMNAYGADVKKQTSWKTQWKSGSENAPEPQPSRSGHPIQLSPPVPCTFINSSDATFAYLTLRT